MRTVTLIALIFLAAPFVRVAVQGTEVRASHWPNGKVRSQVESHRNLQGKLVRHGRMRLFREDGVVLAEGMFRDDREQGRWVWFSPEGKVKAVCEYSEGAGHYREQFDDGSLLLEGPLRGDVREGLWREYYPSGRVKLEGAYLDGKPHGKWTNSTDEDPQRFRSIRFDHGEIAGSN